MQRNLDLIRDMLLKIEANDSNKMYCHDFVTDDLSHEIVIYHLSILQDCMYIESSSINTIGGPKQYIIKRMTASGHDYLDSIRDNTAWSNLKRNLGNNLTSLPLSLIPDIATSYLKSKLGI